MDSSPGNLYFNRGVVQDRALLFGCVEAFKQFYEILFRRQCIALVGIRGIGKSSFLYHLRSPEERARSSFNLDRYLFIDLDLRRYRVRTSDNFFEDATSELVKACTTAGIHIEIEEQLEGDEQFHSLLNQIVDQGYFSVLVLDSFDKVAQNENFGPGFLEDLRSHVSAGLISYVTATRRPLNEVCHQKLVGSPFFNIFHTYTLGGLRAEEARRLIKLPASQTDHPFSDEEASLILKLVGRHPFFLNKVCFDLFAQKQQFGNRQFSEREIKGPLYTMLQQIFEGIWGELSAKQQTFLLDEARQKYHESRYLPE